LIGRRNFIEEMTERVIAGNRGGQSVADLQRAITAASLKSLRSGDIAPADTIVLTVIRKAAIGGGRKIRAKNIVYLNVSTGKEMICRSSLKQFNRTLSFVAREIAKAWPHVMPNPNPEPGVDETPHP